MPEPTAATPDGDETAAQDDPLGDRAADARLDRLLHDLDVANDAHPCRRATRQYGSRARPRDERHEDEPAAGH